MTDKERLEVIERQLNRAEIKRENLDIEDFQNIIEQQLINGNLKWLVKYAREQAERVQELERFSISKDELKEVLNSNENIGELYQFVEDEHSIRDVFAIIVKEMGYLAGALGEYSESYFGLEQQNKRYREAIKECVERMNEGGAGTRSFVFETLKKALEGEE